MVVHNDGGINGFKTRAVTKEMKILYIKLARFHIVEYFGYGLELPSHIMRKLQWLF